MTAPSRHGRATNPIGRGSCVVPSSAFPVFSSPFISRPRPRSPSPASPPIRPRAPGALRRRARPYAGLLLDHASRAQPLLRALRRCHRHANFNPARPTRSTSRSRSIQDRLDVSDLVSRSSAATTFSPAQIPKIASSRPPSSAAATPRATSPPTSRSRA